MLSYILGNLRYRRKRTGLTVLGIVIGTTMILSLMFLGQGLQNTVGAMMGRFGNDLIFVMPGKEDNPFATLAAGTELRWKDVNAIASAEGVRVTVPMQTEVVRADFNGEEKPLLISGVPIREFRMMSEESRGFTVAEGGWPQNEEAVAVILGSEIARKRFSHPIKAGDTLVMRGKSYEVSGVFAPTGDQGDDSSVYMSADRFRRMTGKPPGAIAVFVKVARGYTPDEVAADVKKRLSMVPGVGDFTVFTMENITKMVGDILGVIQLVVNGIAAVALVVGGVGILNTMFTSVLERTREIGILKAVGATNRKVLSIFLIEAGALGALGGLTGVIISISIAKLSELAAKSLQVKGLTITIDPLLVVLVLAFAFGLGMIFGAVPAWQASRLKPSEALRYE